MSCLMCCVSLVSVRCSRLIFDSQFIMIKVYQLHTHKHIVSIVVQIRKNVMYVCALPFDWMWLTMWYGCVSYYVSAQLYITSHTDVV